MSLFETLSEMSKQHANTGDAGQYKYTREEIEKQFEQRQTLSLYNLLDHSEQDLDFLLGCADRRERELRPMKLALNESYMKAVSWMTIIAGAIREKKDREGEAWAASTAKEINETI